MELKRYFEDEQFEKILNLFEFNIKKEIVVSSRERENEIHYNIFGEENNYIDDLYNNTILWNKNHKIFIENSNRFCIGYIKENSIYIKNGDLYGIANLINDLYYIKQNLYYSDSFLKKELNKEYRNYIHRIQLSMNYNKVYELDKKEKENLKNFEDNYIKKISEEAEQEERLYYDIDGFPYIEQNEYLKYKRHPKICYVYRFLDKEGKVLYIGKTNNMLKRMLYHCLLGHLTKEQYNNVYKIQYIIFDNEIDISFYEIFFINYYHAEYNKKDKYEIYKIRDSKIMNLLSNNKFQWIDFGYWEQLKILANQKENQMIILPYNNYKELQKQTKGDNE